MPTTQVVLVAFIAILFPVIPGHLRAQDTTYARGTGLWVHAGVALGRVAVENAGRSGIGPAFEIGAGGTLPSHFRIGVQYVRQQELQENEDDWNARTVMGIVIHRIATSPVSLIAGTGVTRAWYHAYHGCICSMSASAAEVGTGVEWETPGDGRVALRMSILEFWRVGPLRTSEPSCAPGSYSSCRRWDTLNQRYFSMGLLLR